MDSKEAEIPYRLLHFALFNGLVSNAAPAAMLIGPNAVRHMLHFLLNTGADLTVDVKGLTTSHRSQQLTHWMEFHQAQRFLESLPDGHHQIRSKFAETDQCDNTKNRDWFFALGGYAYWGTGMGSVRTQGGKKRYQMDFGFKIEDRYNWDGGKSVTLYGIRISDELMGEMHLQGLAREFLCIGSRWTSVSWTEGEKPLVPKGVMPSVFAQPGGVA